MSQPNSSSPLLGRYSSGTEADEAIRTEISRRLRLPYVASWKQLEFELAPHRGPSEPLLYGGAMGGGKSWAISGGAIADCLIVPNNRVLVARKEFTALRDSTLVTLQDMMPAGVLHNKNEHSFTFPSNGSRLVYTGLGTPIAIQKMKSSEWGSIYLEEASEFDQSIFFMAATRLRWKPARLANRIKLRLTSNPEQCWLKDLFIDKRAPGYGYIPALPSDNPSLSEGYVEELSQLFGNDPAWAEAYLHGSWDAISDAKQVFPSNVLVAAISRIMPPGDTCTWGMDVGRYGGDACVVAERRGGVITILDEWKHKDTWESEKRLVALYLAASLKPTSINIEVNGLGAGVVDAARHETLARADDDVSTEMTAVAVEMHKQLRRKRLPVKAVDVGAAATDSTFKNVRAENAWHVRNLLLAGDLSLPDMPELRTEMAAFRYDLKNDKQIQLEPKDIMRQRLGRSPDRADAVILACAPHRGSGMKTLDLSGPATPPRRPSPPPRSFL